MPWATVTDSGRAQRPTPYAPLYGVENMPRLLCTGRPGRTSAALRDHHVRTPSGVENMPRLLCTGRPGRTAAALRDDRVRTPSGVENVPRLLYLDDRGA